MTKRPTFNGKPSIFFKSKDKRLSKIISIKSPTAFRESIRQLQKGGLKKNEKAALSLAKGRATAQLGRKNLSAKERKQFKAISDMKLPPLS